ncbi:MAG: DUF1178 family protein [Hydrogenophaga sp.]|uniref:DUF1178 family protein n=1 Tax=Hydrogenophaga sp. TaxID=1904254 RepID=UPI0016A63D2C|nr:DUF1178 family protein [Hydrogenophaga sp.]NIM41335.1 DUF1178 family protein [Hydrogenophaga sp.]NIN26651.1 DUF1178 family protein [Hydrogenophaga sp.]NIN29973.1 DUF1178 family protein [Hydrogenophaga sp.]NIN55581.1 DUF1178 family protein [Hydrogenophaga sp.]NIO52578.1 DUF1178 family protein [Hydrogenophaga sp.]
MKVLDLQCAHQHVFEGWFGSEDDFHQQLERGLVSCPLCGDQRVEKKLSAPRLNLRAGREEPPASRPEGVTLSNHPAQAELVELQGRMLKAMREIMTSTEDVGERFAEQARAMHHGEIERRNIRGQTSAAVALELLEEGVEVMPLPMLPAVKDTLQ